MKLSAFLLLLTFCAAGYAAGDKRTEFSAALENGGLPALAAFVGDNGGAWGGPASVFAEASSDDPGLRAAEWRDLNSLLSGGKLDKGGAGLRRELAKVPGAQWHFVIKLERERRALYARLGWGPGGNMVQNSCALVGVKVEPRLCSDRSAKLTEIMEPVRSQGAFSAWHTEEITANMISVRDSRGLRDDLYGGVHWAPCFVYDDGYTRAEIVADAWANALAPAYSWWHNFDRGTHDYLYKAGGRDWCGSAILEQAVQAQVKARRAAEAAPAAPPRSATLDSLQASPF